MNKREFNDILDDLERGNCLKYPLPLATKIIRLYAIAMLNYRQPIGDRAWGIMNKMIGRDITDAISFLTGFASGWNGNSSTYEQLLGVGKISTCRDLLNSNLVGKWKDKKDIKDTAKFIKKIRKRLLKK